MAGLSLWSNFYSYATMLIPPLLTAPRYFAGEVEFGVITQVLTIRLKAQHTTDELLCLGWNEGSLSAARRSALHSVT